MTEDARSTSTRQAREGLDRALEKAGDMAREQAEAATDAVTNRAGENTDTAAEAVDAAAAQLDPDSPQAQAADQISATLREAAGMLRQADLDKITGTVTRFARENPALFLGGAALAGFAATRFLKASSTDPAASDKDHTDPWRGHLDSPVPQPEPEPGMPFGGSRGSLRPQNGNARIPS